MAWLTYLAVARRCVLLFSGALSTAVAIASHVNPWNFTVLETTQCHPVTMASFAAIAFGIELCLTFRGFFVWTVGGGAIACALLMLLVVLALSWLHEPAQHDGPTVATSPDGHITAIVVESSGSWLGDGAVLQYVYLHTTKGLDREMFVAAGCLNGPAANVRFLGNRTLELRDEVGEYHRVGFDRNLNVDATVSLSCAEAPS